MIKGCSRTDARAASLDVLLKSYMFKDAVRSNLDIS